MKAKGFLLLSLANAFGLGACQSERTNGNIFITTRKTEIWKEETELINKYQRRD